MKKIHSHLKKEVRIQMRMKKKRENNPQRQKSSNHQFNKLITTSVHLVSPILVSAPQTFPLPTPLPFDSALFSFQLPLYSF